MIQSKWPNNVCLTMESLRTSQFFCLQGSMSQQSQSGTECLEESKRAAGHQSTSEAQIVLTSVNKYHSNRINGLASKSEGKTGKKFPPSMGCHKKIPPH